MPDLVDDATLGHQLRELEALHDSLRVLTSTLDLGEILRTVLARMRALVAPQALSLLLFDRQRDELVFAATELLREQTVLEPGVIDGARMRLDQGIAGWSPATASPCGSTTQAPTHGTIRPSRARRDSSRAG